MGDINIMTENEVINKIYGYLKNQNEHTIMENMTNESVSLFWENISVLYKAGVLQNNKAVKRFCDKLRIRTGYDRDQCLQGLSEMVFWLYAIKNSYTYEMDKKLKNQENTDVDIQLLKYGYKFNIEIKTPKQVKEDDDKVLGVNIPFRSFKNKDTQKTYIDKLEKEVFPQIINKPDGMYTGYNISKINDNKVIEYLRSCQTKFNYEANSINVLVISVSSQQMQDYWGYIYNPFTGIFTEDFKNSFYDKSGKDVKHNDFDAVDVIYLTNIVEGHIRKIEGFDPWKLENYCGIFCINPFSVRTKDKKDIEVYEKLLNILPNDTILFEKEHDQANQRGKEMNISVDPIFMQEYISEHYPKLI